MKKPMSTAMISVLATLASIGVAHAEDGKFQIPSGNQAIIEQLVQSGHIIPLAEANWYQINQDRLDDSLRQSDSGDARAQGIIEKLKAIVGDKVDIKIVPLSEARPGGQDYGGE